MKAIANVLYLETVGISGYVSYLGNHLHINNLTWFNSIDYYKMNEGEALVIAFISLFYWERKCHEQKRDN